MARTGSARIAAMCSTDRSSVVSKSSVVADGSGGVAQMLTSGVLQANLIKILGSEQFYWDAGNIIPEDGTTVTIELWRSGSMVYQQQGITGTSFNIPVDALSTGSHEIRIYTMRDGRRNYTNFQHTFNVILPSRDTGYGNSYGFTYGV